MAATLGAAATPSSTAAAAASEVAMEVATRLIEHHVAEATGVISALGWGPAVDAAAMLTAVETMAKRLRMVSLDSS